MDSAEPLFRDNLKVHFAGCECYATSIILKYANVRYGLWTAYPFIARKLNIPFYQLSHQKKLPIQDSVQIIENCFKHTILDSGLFTLMFGAMKGKKDAAFIETWYENLVEFVRENNIQSTCVEVDCQKVLGIDYAWRFRERMRNDLPNNRQINVFHIEDGRKGLDRLIEFSNYIALSVPEWRIIRPFDYRTYLLHLALYIKQKKPTIDIHLLGCTEQKLLRTLNFCTSADSVSWRYLAAYREVPFGQQRIRNQTEETEGNVCALQLKQIIREVEKLSHTPLTEGMKRSFHAALVSAIINKMHYAAFAGNQD